MLELASYGLTALVAILIAAFCFACKDGSASFIDKQSPRSMDDADLPGPKGVERCTAAAHTDSGLKGQKHEGAPHG